MEDPTRIIDLIFHRWNYLLVLFYVAKNEGVAFIY